MGRIGPKTDAFSFSDPLPGLAPTLGMIKDFREREKSLRRPER